MSSIVERQILEDASSYGKELNANSDDDTASDTQETASNNTDVKKKTTPDKLRKRTNKSHFSPSDPDARMSYKPGKVTRLNYLGQVSVDTAHHVITHIQAFHADEGDAKCLPEVIKNTMNNLAVGALEVEEVLADAGYSSEAALTTLAEKNIEAFIPNKSGYKESREGFIYDTDNDRYTCVNGKHLTFRHVKKQGGNTHKIYKTMVADCLDCPFKKTCANSVGYKALEDSIEKKLYEQMSQRVNTEKGRKMARLRSSTVEPVLGTLVNFTAMSKVYTKGINLANKCMIMAALAYNLKKLIRGIPIMARKKRSKRLRKGLSMSNEVFCRYSAATYAVTKNYKWLNNHLLCKFNYSAI